MLITIFIVFGFCFLPERLFPGWKLPEVPTWTVRVLAVNFVQLGVVTLAGLSWEKWLSRESLFHLSDHVPDAAGGMIAYFVATFAFYWWHRWRHEYDFLWTRFHQIHHSPQRLEVITSFYKHPLEMAANSVIGSVLVYTLCTALGEFFYHTNVRTPQWIGYVFQRPEMHRIHHEYEKHSHNYGDVVWWDMLFGTYRNPKEFRSTCGFDNKRNSAWRTCSGLKMCTKRRLRA